MVSTKKIALIQTSPDSPPGSMSVYAGLVMQALKSSEHFDVETIRFFDPSGGSMRRHHLWRLRHARSFFCEHPADLYHLLDGSMAGLLPFNIWKKTVVTVHDLIPLLQLRGRLPGMPGLAGHLIIRRMLSALRQVAGLAAVSEHTAGDLQEFAGRSDVAVIYNPVRPLPSPDEPGALPPRFLLHVGNNAAYKNRSGVLDVFERLQDIGDLHLIMAGHEPSCLIRRKAAALDRVQFRVDVTDAELSALYANASVFLFPSLYEGFGMPVLEAMQAGCPVVCSNAASLPEVAGGAALAALPGDVDALAACCRELLTDPSRRAELVECGRRRAAGFTMQRLSDGLAAWYSDCLNRIGETI